MCKALPGDLPSLSRSPGSACVLNWLSCFIPVWLLGTPWTVAHRAPLSMEFPRQEYWSGLPCPHLGDLPDPGTEPESLLSPALAEGFFTTSATWEAPIVLQSLHNCLFQPHSTSFCPQTQDNPPLHGKLISTGGLCASLLPLPGVLPF